MERENRGDRDPYRGPNGESYVTRWGKGRARSYDNPFSSVSICDSPISQCFCLLPFCNLMMLVCVCKQFSEWQEMPFFARIAKECLCVSFPMMDRRFLPSLGYSIYRKLYVDFFCDRSTERLLFSHCGYRVLKEWTRSVFPEYRHVNQNLPLNLSVLRKGGFFFSLYSRLRTTSILRFEIRDCISMVIMIFNQMNISNEQRNQRAMPLLCRIIRLEFILNLLQNAYSVECLQIHSSSWKRDAMHLLEDTDPRWHIDICRRYVADLNVRFAEVASNPTIRNIRVIFTNLNDDIHDEDGIFLGVIQYWCARVNPFTDTAGLFSSFFFDMNTDIVPSTWHNSKYMPAHEGDEDTRSPFDVDWMLAMQLLRRSRDWGVMVSHPVFVPSVEIMQLLRSSGDWGDMVSQSRFVVSDEIMQLLRRSMDWGVTVSHPVFVTSEIIHVDLFSLGTDGLHWQLFAEIRDILRPGGEFNP